MKALLSISMLVIAHAQWMVLASDPMTREDIDQDIPLSEAVTRANERFREFVGTLFPEQEYPPLTEDEVVAAVMAIKAKQPEIKDSVLRRQLGEDPEPQPGGIKVTVRPRQ